MKDDIFAEARRAHAGGDFEATLRELEKISSSDKYTIHTRAQSAGAALRVLKMMGRIKESRKEFRRADALFAQALQENTPALFLEYGMLLLEFGTPKDIPRAREILEQGHAAHPSDIELALALIQTRRLETHGGENRAHWRDHKLGLELERALLAAEDGAVRDFRLGRLYFILGDSQRGRARLQSALESEVAEIVSPARRVLIRVCLEALDYSAAQVLAEQEVKAEPYDPEARHLLAHAYLRAYNLNQALTEYEKLAVMDGENSRSWAGLGLVQIALGRDGLDTYSRAALLFSRGLECPDTNAQTPVYRAGLLYARAYAYAELFQRDPESGYPHLVRARDDLRAALELDHSPSETTDALAMVRARMGPARGLANLKRWGPAGFSLLSLFVFGLTQAWLFLDVSAKSLPVPAYMLLTLGSLATGLGGLFLARTERPAPSKLPLTPPPIHSGDGQEVLLPYYGPRFPERRD